MESGARRGERALDRFTRWLYSVALKRSRTVLSKVQSVADYFAHVSPPEGIRAELSKSDGEMDTHQLPGGSLALATSFREARNGEKTHAFRHKRQKIAVKNRVKLVRQASIAVIHRPV